MRKIIPLICVAAVLQAGCGHLMPGPGAEPRIDRVFFAQHHVLEPQNPLFKLVGDLEALIKVQVYSDTPVESPCVFAILKLDGKTNEIRLLGPRTLARLPDGDPVLMDQKYDDSFTAMIPGSWIRPGLEVAVELREYDYRDVGSDDRVYTNNVCPNYIKILDRRDLGDIKIGAPTRLTIQMFDIHYFGLGLGADFPEGWETELECKLPVADLVINRARNIVFNEIVMPPQLEGPSAKYSSPEDYKRRTGKDYDGEQGIALRWGSALKAAGGTYSLWRPYHINIAGVYSGGQASGYRSCANLHRHGVILHELGHTFGLPHWNTNKDYPYKFTMYGEKKGEPSYPNAGPAWAFDLHRREFIPPYVMKKGRRVWKNDPMNGGGWNREKEYMYRNFSDYSMRRIQKCLEERAVYWNEELGKYAKWNQDTGKYDVVVENDGVKFPIERDVDVISLLASANLVVPEANIIYPPIGPYRGCLITRFDAESKEDRAAAARLGYSEARCNVALRVTQGGKTKTYLMRAKVTPDDDPLKTFNASAINLPARDGEVTMAELLYCPDLINKGITAESKALCSWRK